MLRLQAEQTTLVVREASTDNGCITTPLIASTIASLAYSSRLRPSR